MNVHGSSYSDGLDFVAIMTLEYEINRYAAYFRGWCQAFGEHEGISGGDTGISWLFSEYQVGFIMPQQLTRALYREVLGKRGTPVLELNRKCARIGAFHYPLKGPADEQGLAAIKYIFDNGSGVSLFLTSHFMYGTGSRIITLSNKRPLPIIYKEIGAMGIQLD
jgi:hypothetical protein